MGQPILDDVDATISVPAPAALAVIVGVAALLRIVFFTGYHGYDDLHYIQRAFDLGRGDFSAPASIWAARIGVVVPTAVVYYLFGVTPLTTNALPFLCSMLGVGAAYLLGKRLYGERAALVAAWLLAILPLDVIFAGMLFPTEPVLLFSGVGLGCFILAERDRQPALYLASGLSLGFAGLAHETTLFALAFYPVYVLTVGRPARTHLIVAAGILAGLALDPLIHGWMGDPWARLTALNRASTVLGTDSGVDYRGWNLAWIGEPLVRLFVERTLGLFSWLLLPVVALRLWKPGEWTDRVLALVIAVDLLWLMYGTISPVRYAPLTRLPRYLAPLILPAVWLLGHELGDRASPRLRAAALAGLSVSSIVCLMCDSGSALAPYRELQAVLARERPARVAVEPAHRFPLLFAEGFRPSYALVELNAAELRRTVVVAVGTDARARVESLPGVVPLARVVPPETLYLKLLRSRFVAAILRATRPAARYRQYAKKIEPWSLWVYRVP
jgi:4-amino-4-deoxy-L-arabinose transferase-like glycosyltransferase